MRAASLAALAVLLSALPCRAQRWAIDDPGQGAVALPAGQDGASELSAITWVSGTRYYALSDDDGALYPVTIAVDPHGGTITAATVGRRTTLRPAGDLEGVAYDAADGTVLVSDETGSAIRRYRVADGALVGPLPVPKVYATTRRNLSLESLALDPDGRSLWTANEEATTRDGPTSTFGAGTTVRLQRFTRQAAAATPAANAAPLPGAGEFEASGQWAYVTDPLAGDILLPGRDIEASGVSDLVALPGGGLLVLERAYGGSGFRSRLYEVDFAGATDVSARPALEAATFTPTRKTLLWQRLFPATNFEGAALGPTLDRGARSLILISDDGHGLRQALYPLVLRRGVGAGKAEGGGGVGDRDH